jgi:transposase InsO family protein
MAKLFKVNRTSYYKWKNNPLGQRKKDDLKIGKSIKDIFHTSRETYGSPRIVDKLRKAGIKCGKNRVNRLMKTLGLKAKAAKKYIITTDSSHSLKIAPNLLDRNFKPEIPNIVYTSDLTYVKTEEGWLFLCIIMDLFSRKIIGWSMSDNICSVKP